MKSIEFNEENQSNSILALKNWCHSFGKKANKAQHQNTEKEKKHKRKLLVQCRSQKEHVLNWFELYNL